ncbi:hypothetical protein GH5_02520 [Leishmania sp. Ghana 2012 LV757]|uniref:hypothetical protein n=1 Tax=Leishmania sp. Ghana 2012 LV757 TaxID=2803181 RepID=UPI001B78D359|nr:hypothetical protein GH5_02520 [Leishmania sp. Ghana 2012 LV757]
MATATPPRGRDTALPLQSRSGEGLSRPAMSLVEASGSFANEQYFDLPCAPGNEDSGCRSSSAVSVCSGDKAGESQWHAPRNRLRRKSEDSDTGTRGEYPAYPATASSVASSFFSAHLLTEAYCERTAEQRLTENLYGINMLRSSGSQASERASDTAEPVAKACGLWGAAPSSSVQPATRMAQNTATTMAASSRGRPLADVDDPYHILSIPTAGTMYLISRAGSDQESGNGGGRFTVPVSQQDLYCLNNSALRLSTDVSASLSTRQQRNGVALRGGSASATSSCDRVAVPVCWDYGEWWMTPQSRTRDNFSVHLAGTATPTSVDERHSTPLANSASADVTTELTCRPPLYTRNSLPRPSPTTAVARQRQADTDTTAKARNAPLAVGSQLPYGATDSKASLQAKEQPPVAASKNVAASPPPPPGTSAVSEVCVAVEHVPASAASLEKGAEDDSTVADIAVHGPREAVQHRDVPGSAKPIVRQRRRRVSDSGAPNPEAAPFPTADGFVEQPPLHPSSGNRTTYSVARDTQTTPSTILSGIPGRRQSAFTTAASVSRFAVSRVSNLAPLSTPGVHPIRSGADAPPRTPSPVCVAVLTATRKLLPPQAVVAVGQLSWTACTSFVPKVPHAPAGQGATAAPLLSPDNTAKGCPSDVSYRPENHSVATTVAGATSSSASTFSEDLTSGSSPRRACAQSLDLQQPPVGAEPRSNSNTDTFLLLCGRVENAADPPEALRAGCEVDCCMAGQRDKGDAHVATSCPPTLTLTVAASETPAAPTMRALATSRGLSDEGGIAHPTEDAPHRVLEANERAQPQLPKECALDSGGDGAPSRRAVHVAVSASPGIPQKASPTRELAHGHEAARAQEKRKSPYSPTRSPPGQRRRVGFKENMEVVLPDSKFLRVSTSSWLEFRKPNMREQGKEMMPSTEEVYTHLMTRSNALCALVVVDEDAVRKPCLVVSGLSVRVYEEDKEVSLAMGRMAHGVKALKRRCCAAPSRFLRSASYDDDEDSSDSDGAAVGIHRGVGLSNRAASSGGGGLPSTIKSFVLLPDKKERRSRSGVFDLADPRAGEFDRYLHKFDVDETLSRLAGKKECHSVALELLMRTWVTGHNTCLLLGNGNGRSTHSLDVVVAAVESAMSMLRERLRDPASCVELHICMGEVADDEDNGGAAVVDLLTSSSGSDEGDDENDESEKVARRRSRGASHSSKKSSASRPRVRLARGPLLGTFVKGLRSVKIDDATCSTGAIGRVLTLGFLRFNMSAHSSRNNSMSNLSSLNSAALRRVHTSFATLRLKTICRGADMRSARLSARESATRGGKFSSQVRRSRSVEYRADVFVSSLLLVYFGTEYMVLDTLVQRSQAYRTAMREEGEGFVHPNAPVRHQKPVFHPANWPNAIGLLESLLCDALGGRARTLVCLCLSEYDLRATLWLRAVSRARRITNVMPNCGNVRNYLVYLLEQYDALAVQQRRRKQDSRLLLPELGTPATSMRQNGGRLAAVRCSKMNGQWSAYCVKMVIADLDAFLAAPTGEIPSMERLEIANEMIPGPQPDPLTGLRLAFLSMKE